MSSNAQIKSARIRTSYSLAAAVALLVSVLGIVALLQYSFDNRFAKKKEMAEQKIGDSEIFDGGPPHKARGSRSVSSSPTSGRPAALCSTKFV
jgi:hypothetical protein